jgi:hypothetical protein
MLLISGIAGVLTAAPLTTDPKQRNAILQRAKEFYIKSFVERTFSFFCRMR